MASMPIQAGGTVELAVAGEDAFDSSGCIIIDTIKNQQVITIRAKQEFCERNGKLVGKVVDLNGTYLRVTVPGAGADDCSLNQACRFRTFGPSKLIFERIGEDSKGQIALLRRAD